MLSNILAAAAASALVVPAPANYHAPGSGKGVYVTSVTLGQIDPNGVVPTIDGVPGAGTSNWDIPFPAAVLQTGTNYEATFT